MLHLILIKEPCPDITGIPHCVAEHEALVSLTVKRDRGESTTPFSVNEAFATRLPFIDNLTMVHQRDDVILSSSKTSSNPLTE